MTTTDLSSDEIHNFGLGEVARLEGEIEAFMKTLGLAEGSLVTRFDKLSSDPRFTVTQDDAGRAQILAGYRDLLYKMRARLPNYFLHVLGQ